MAENIEFELVTPSALVMSEAAEMVVIPGAEGDLGFLKVRCLNNSERPPLVDIEWLAPPINFFLFFLFFFIFFLILEFIKKVDNISSNISLSKKYPFFFILFGLCSSNIDFFHDI